MSLGLLAEIPLYSVIEAYCQSLSRLFEEKVKVNAFPAFSASSTSFRKGSVEA